MFNTTTETAATETETACLIRLERTSQEKRRRELEGEMSAASLRGDHWSVKAARAELKRCDRALMELQAGRLPEVGDAVHMNALRVGSL